MYFTLSKSFLSYKAQKNDTALDFETFRRKSRIFFVDLPPLVFVIATVIDVVHFFKLVVLNIQFTGKHCVTFLEIKYY